MENKEEVGFWITVVYYGHFWRGYIRKKDIKDGYDLRREIFRMCMNDSDRPIDYDLLDPNGDPIDLEGPIEQYKNGLVKIRRAEQ